MHKPYPYQKKIINRFKLKESAALFMDMGTGKTCVSINLLRFIYQSYGEVEPTLIFCPQIAIRNWKREFKKFSKIDPDLICVVEGSTPKRIKLIEDETYRIFIINYEALRTGAIRKAFHKMRPKVMILDESHKVKTRGTKTYKTLKWWRRRESNPRPQALRLKLYTLSPSLILLRATRRAGKTHSQSGEVLTCRPQTCHSASLC